MVLLFPLHLCKIKEKVLLYLLFFVPLLKFFNQSGNVDHNDGNGGNDAEEGHHPVFDLQAFAGVGFCHKLLPAKAKALECTEDHETQGANGQQVSGNDEVPKIQYGGVGAEGFEAGKQAATQSGSGGG